MFDSAIISGFNRGLGTRAQVRKIAGQSYRDKLLKILTSRIAKVAELADAPDLGTENSTNPDDPKDKPP